ncbi:hypothetical protein CISIN_1g0083481mg, partial [Citrus sinensis]
FGLKSRLMATKS